MSGTKFFESICLPCSHLTLICFLSLTELFPLFTSYQQDLRYLAFGRKYLQSTGVTLNTTPKKNKHLQSVKMTEFFGILSAQRNNGAHFGLADDYLMKHLAPPLYTGGQLKRTLLDHCVKPAEL